MTDGPVKLSYHASPNQIYKSSDTGDPSYSDITITAINAGLEAVNLYRVGFTFTSDTSEGGTSTDLVSGGGEGITVSSSAEWPVTVNSNLSYMVLPVLGALAVGESFSFTLQQVPISAAAGTGVINIQERYLDADTGVQSTSERGLGILTIAKVDIDLSIDSFTCTPIDVAPGEAVELAWETTGASSVSIVPSVSDDPLPTSGSATIDPLNTTTTYTLTATGAVASHTKQCVATVKTAEIVSLVANPTVIGSGTGVKPVLSWLTQNVDEVTVSPPGKVTAETAMEVSPEATTTYTVSGTADNGTQAQGQITINVVKPIITTFVADVDDVANVGDEVILSWAVDYASSLSMRIETLGGTTETVPLEEMDSFLKHTLTDTTTFTLICEGLEEVTQTITIAVPAAITSFFPESMDVPTGGESKFTWTTVGAETVTLKSTDGFNVYSGLPRNGSKSITVTVGQQYQLVATGVDGPATKDVVLNIFTPPFIETFEYDSTLKQFSFEIGGANVESVYLSGAASYEFGGTYEGTFPYTPTSTNEEATLTVLCAFSSVGSISKTITVG